MYKSYHEIQKEAIKVVENRNSDADTDTKQELIWMYVQGYISSMQAYLDSERSKG